MCRFFVIPQTYSSCAASQPHFIRVKHFIQCQAARDRSRRSDLPRDRRICENPVPIKVDEGDDESAQEETGSCPACAAEFAITEASESSAISYAVVHAYTSSLFIEWSHITDVDNAVPKHDQAPLVIRPLEVDPHDLLVLFNLGNRPVHQELGTDSQQKILAEANKPGHSSRDIPMLSLAQFLDAQRDPTGPLPTGNQLARSFRGKKAPSMASSSNVTSSVFSDQSQQSSFTHITSDSGYSSQPRKLALLVSTKLKNVPENPESISEESSPGSDIDAKRSPNPDHLNLNSVVMRRLVNNSWIETEVNGEVSYINFFDEKKTQRQKPRDAFIKSLPETEQLQEGSTWDLGQEIYSLGLTARERQKGIIGRGRRDKGPESN